MSKNNVKVALDDWGFDSPKTSVKKEIKPVDTRVGKSENEEVGNSQTKQTGKQGSKEINPKLTVTKVGKSALKDYVKPNNQYSVKLENKNFEMSAIQVIGKSESQKTDKTSKENSTEKLVEAVDKTILKSKTFDLPPNLIRRIKMEAAANDKKEYQIALEAFEQYFQESFRGS